MSCLRGRAELKTIAIIAQKGGVGKTTVAIHLATAASIAGYATAIIDIDPQTTATRWRDRRQSEAPEVASGHAARLAFMTNAARENGADLVFIDTAPNADTNALDAAKVADLVLMPCRPATFDLDAMDSTLATVRLVGTKAFVVMNFIQARSAIVGEAVDVLEGKGAVVAPVMLFQRVAYSHGVVDGLTALEFEPGGKAACEIVALFEWLCGQLGMTARRHDVRAA